MVAEGCAKTIWRADWTRGLVDEFRRGRLRPLRRLFPSPRRHSVKRSRRSGGIQDCQLCSFRYERASRN